MTRRLPLLAAAAAVFAVAVIGVSHAPQGFGAATAQAATTYRVVGTGDSILGMAFGFGGPGGVVNSNGRWLDLEFGRNAYTAGMSGRASTASIWPLVLSRSQPNGWIVISDNALGVSDAGWRTLMRRIVQDTPNDRCLLGVLPGYRADVNAQYAADIARRASIMGQEFAAQPCRAFVYLNQYLRQNPARFADGQHPDATAQQWIRGSVLAWVG